MRKRICFYLSISLVFAAICFLLTSDLVVAGLVMLLYILAFILVIDKLISSHVNERNVKRSCHKFIQSYVVGLSCTSSLDKALESACLSLRDEEKKLLDFLGDASSLDKIGYLRRVFQVDVYDVFLSIIDLYVENGGDILKIASAMLRENTLEEENLLLEEKDEKKALIEFSSLWGMSALVMGILRFGLSNFYEDLVGNIGFLLMSLSYFLLAIISFFMFAKSICGNDILKKKGASKNEKKERKETK